MVVSSCKLWTILFLAGGLAAHVWGEESDNSTNLWEKSVEFGLNMAKGNSDTILFTYGVIAKRDTGEHTWKLELNGSHGENNSELSADKANGSFEYAIQFSDRKYLLFIVSGAYDTLANLKYRAIASPGFKYFFFRKTTTRLQGEFGPSYVWQKEGDDRQNHPAIRLAERFEFNVGIDDLLWQAIEYLPDIYKGQGYLVNIELGLESGIWQGLTTKWVLRNEFNSQPAEDKDRSDLSLVAALKYKF